MSKPVMVGFVAVCLVLAVVLFFVMGTEEKGGYEQLAGQLTWVKCNNPDCNAEYEMDTAEFKGLIAEQKKLNLIYPGDPPVACKECGQLSLLQATKCPKCGNVFFRGELGPTHFKDECPKCGYSEIKERRQQKTSTTE
jgi:ssDNA-binding Zn-finger/Zn-ribbon topoisomerase 1